MHRSNEIVISCGPTQVESNIKEASSSEHTAHLTTAIRAASSPPQSDLNCLQTQIHPARRALTMSDSKGTITLCFSALCPLARLLSAPVGCGLGSVCSHDVSSCSADSEPTSNTRELYFLVQIIVGLPLINK